jgi:hypothetical protein
LSGLADFAKAAIALNETIASGPVPADLTITPEKQALMAFDHALEGLLEAFGLNLRDLGYIFGDERPGIVNQLQDGVMTVFSSFANAFVHNPGYNDISVISLSGVVRNAPEMTITLNSTSGVGHIVGPSGMIAG